MVKTKSKLDGCVSRDEKRLFLCKRTSCWPVEVLALSLNELDDLIDMLENAKAMFKKNPNQQLKSVIDTSGIKVMETTGLK